MAPFLKTLLSGLMFWSTGSSSRAQPGSLRNPAGIERRDVRNREYLRATCAAACLVANADGKIADVELDMLLRAVRNYTEMSGFAEGEALAYFDLCADAIHANLRNEQTLLETVSRVREQSRQARTLMRVCLDLSQADNQMSQEEEWMLTRICERLGLSPSHYGLGREAA